MCMLCSKDEQERNDAKLECRNLAYNLRALAELEDALASGRIKPHSAACSGITAKARSVIRRLVEDYV